MEKLKSISELKLLTHALNHLLGKRYKEEEHLKKSPDSKIAKHWIDTYTEQIDEIHSRIVELEKQK